MTRLGVPVDLVDIAIFTGSDVGSEINERCLGRDVAAVASGRFSWN